MTPREHLAKMLSYRDDLNASLAEAAARLRLKGDDAYWRYTQEYVFDEAMYVVHATEELDEEWDDTFEAWLPEADRLVAGEGS